MPRTIISSVISVICLLVASGVQAAPYATAWVEGHNSRTRLIIGGAPTVDGKVQRYAALEIAMKPGWKTYWRQPGTSGGIPPQLTWSGSSNLKSASLKFPAPKRMVDPTGATIGYKERVVFPVAIEAINPAQPLVLNLKAFFGVCREICIPAQAAFKVTLGDKLFQQTPPELAKALAKVPVAAGRADRNTPKLMAVESKAMSSGKHALIFDVGFPVAGAAGADLFAETGDLQSLGMSKVIAHPKAGPKSGTARLPEMRRYQVIVDDPGIWKSIAKQGLVLTIVSDKSAYEQRVAGSLKWPK